MALSTFILGIESNIKKFRAVLRQVLNFILSFDYERSELDMRIYHLARAAQKFEVL